MVPDPGSRDQGLQLTITPVQYLPTSRTGCICAVGVRLDGSVRLRLHKMLCARAECPDPYSGMANKQNRPACGSVAYCARAIFTCSIFRCNQINQRVCRSGGKPFYFGVVVVVLKFQFFLLFFYCESPCRRMSCGVLVSSNPLTLVNLNIAMAESQSRLIRFACCSQKHKLWRSCINSIAEI